MELSTRAKNIAPSATLKAAAKARALKAEGIDVISLTVGEPDFVTPKVIQEAAQTAIVKGQASFYTPTSGLPALKSALKNHIKKNYGLDYQANQLLVTPGAKFALYTAFQVLLNPGDEVLIPVPYWVSYSEQVKLAGGVPLFVHPSDPHSGKVTVSDLEKMVSPQTKILLLNSPSNPNGMIYTADELVAIADFVSQHDLIVVADDIYSNLVYNHEVFTSIAMINPEIQKRTIVITGVSKTYSMTGWRIGFAFGDQEVIQAMSDLQSQAASNPTTVSQYAAIAALNDGEKAAEEMRQAFEERLNKAYDLVEKIPGFTLVKPHGAFYLFPNVAEAMANCGYDDLDVFVEDLLQEAHVAVVSGTGFGVHNAIRLSYAVSPEVFQEAVERILAFLQQKSLKCKH